MVNSKKPLKRFLSMLLVAVMVITLLPAMTLPAYAAGGSGTLAGLADTSIDATWTASTDDVNYANWSVQSGTEVIGTAAYKTTFWIFGNDNNTTLTLTNNKGEAAILSFTYTIGGSGKIQIDGDTDTVTSSGSYSDELAAGESRKIYLESNGSGTSAKITLSNITLLVKKDVKTTFQPAENGSYTVDGKAVTEEYSNTQSSLKAYSVKATPNSGYKFVGWYSVTDDSYLTTNATANLNFDSDKMITAVFTATDNAVYSVGTKKFYDLDEATTYAKSNSIEKVTLEQNGRSITGTHTIPAGVTLLIPFDNAATFYKETPVSTQGGSVSNKNNAFRTLTLAEGAVLNVEGCISVGGTYRAAAGSSSGYMAGNYGLLNLTAGSSVNVKNGGSLYAWGFITGTGSVVAESGSTVWEWFQIGDFRGGTATGGVGNGVFPFSQYFVQNIEAPLTIQAGAKEQVYTGVYAGSKVNNASIEFIGDSGMFKLDSGSLTRIYDGAADRMIYTVSGDIELNSLSLNLVGANINSANYVLPLTNNLTINIASGKTTINQDLALLAGVQMSIAKGADMTIANGINLYVYDADEWNAANYTCLGKFVSLPFAYSRTKTRTNADLVDAKIDVNGTLTVNGSVYTTVGGANICSSAGGGKYIQQAAPGTATTTYQYTQSGSSVSRADIPITAAKLLNADGTFEETANAVKGDFYAYKKGKWTKNDDTTEVTITFDANGGTGTMDSQTVTAGEEAALTANTFTREGYTFTGWNTAADGTGTAYADGASVTLDENTTLYAQWKANTYTVTWVDENGTELEKDKEVPYGTTPAYNGAEPTKQGDAQYSYAFAGWSPEIVPVTNDVTYKATYTQSINEYTITWENADGTELRSEQVAYGKVPSYGGDTPTKTGDAEHYYTFSGWTPEIKPVDGDAAYTAVYTEGINTYTVTWKNWDGTELEKDENVDYGTTPEYNGTEPVHEGDVQYSYTFKGWSPAVNTVTGSITYTAVFEQTTNKYTITWKNGDEVLKTDQVAYGEMPVWSGETPIKTDSTGRYNYTFKGWTPGIQKVTGDAVYSAEFEQTENTFTVTWVDSDGKTVLEKDENVAYGSKPSYESAEPAKAADNQYTYTFKGWDPEITDASAVTADVTYKAVYDTTVKTYTVTWKNYDGTVLKTDENADYGTMPSYDGSTPVKAADNDYTYTFKGWDPAPVPVTGNADYTAVYSSTPIVRHTVTFDANGGGGSMNPQTFILGVDTRLTANSFTREGYKFTGWNTAADGSGAAYTDEGAMSNLQEDMTLYAQWQFWDGWLTDGTGRQYYADGNIQKSGWTTIEGAQYYLDKDTGYAAVNGVYWLPYPDGYGPDEWDIKNNDEYVDLGYSTNSYFIFDVAGVFQNNLNGKNTLTSGTKVYGKSNNYDLENDTVVWLAAGELLWHPGLVSDGTAYFYFPTDYFEDDNPETFIKDKDYTVSKTNDLTWPSDWGEGSFTSGKYSFDADGKLLLRDGLTEVDGETFYYVKGIKTYAGLIELDGSYYYINSSCKMVHDCNYTISKTNGLLPAGTYTIGHDGKLVREDTKLNGIVKESSTTWYYYVNGVKTYAGLIRINGDYYYVNSKYEVIHDRNYFISKTNGLLKQKTYAFDSDGKLVLPDESLNGIVKQNDGTWYYYVNGIKTYAGLIQIGGDYYYVNSKYEVIHDRSYCISKTNGLKAQGTYEFDKDGKMVIGDETLNGIVKQDDGTWYYYENGLKTYAGLIKIDGYYYYVNSSFKVIHGQKYFISKTNNLMPNASYEFDEEGRLVQ